MKKICVVTATRAEYGLLRNVIRRIQDDEELELCLIVTGAHLLEEYGNTVNEIIQDGFEIREKIPILKSGVQQTGAMIQAMAVAIEKFHDVFCRQKPDMLVVLGDRYELLSICEAALFNKIPIAHISGGEVTAGAIDDTIRHCITKMSQIHFPGCEEYRRRIIQLGEQPDKVFNYGDVGIENILTMNYMSIKELEQSMEIKFTLPIVSVTFHPETLAKETPKQQMRQVLDAIGEFDNLCFIFTGANADAGGNEINEMVQAFIENHANCYYFKSLGIRRYLSLLRNSEMIIGNSSSGIVEAPSFGIPTVNIGDRQKGRLQATSILNCKTVKEDIVKKIETALSKDFKTLARQTKNPYGSGNTSEGIIREIKNFLQSGESIAKTFYDLNVQQ